MYFVIDYCKCNQKIPKKQKQCQTQVLYKTFAKWSFAEKAPLFRQGLCRMPQMQGTESEGEGSVLTHMTKPESRK